MANSPVDPLVPHAGRMLLLDGVVEHGPDHITCTASVDDLELFRRSDGSVPAWVGVELMAQAIAAFGGVQAASLGQPPPTGLLLGSRRVEFDVPRLEAGTRVEARAQRVWGERGLVSFACELRDPESGRRLASARLNTFVPDDFEAMRAGAAG